MMEDLKAWNSELTEHRVSAKDIKTQARYRTMLMTWID